MTTPKTKLAGLALIAALYAGFTLGLTAPAWAGWDEAAAAYLSGDYGTAIREFRPLAEQGDAGAQYKLGVMYDKGRGVPRNPAEADVLIALVCFLCRCNSRTLCRWRRAKQLGQPPKVFLEGPRAGPRLAGAGGDITFEGFPKPIRS